EVPVFTRVSHNRCEHTCGFRKEVHSIDAWIIKWRITEMQRVANSPGLGILDIEVLVIGMVQRVGWTKRQAVTSISLCVRCPYDSNSSSGNIDGRQVAIINISEQHTIRVAER